MEDKKKFMPDATPDQRSRALIFCIKRIYTLTHEQITVLTED